MKIFRGIKVDFFFLYVCLEVRKYFLEVFLEDFYVLLVRIGFYIIFKYIFVESYGIRV